MTMIEFDNMKCGREQDRIMIENQVNIPEMNEREYQRLTNDRNGMFKKWSVITNNTAIAQFMREGIDPTKEYTKREIMELCNQFKIRLIDLLTAKINSSHRQGLILIKISNNIYKLHPKLIEKYNQYF
jgi:hypothetical protein